MTNAVIEGPQLDKELQRGKMIGGVVFGIIIGVIIGLRNKKG